MKFTAIIASLLVVFTSIAQVDEEQVPRFQKFPVAETGHFMYFPEGTEVVFTTSDSEDGSKVYTTDVPFGNFNFAAIVVDLKDVTYDTKEDKEALITAYLDFLRENYSIAANAGIGFGHTLESSPDAVGAIDYWEDDDLMQYAVKAWMDEKTLAVLMIYGANEYPYYNAQTLFLDGFRF